MNQKMFLVFVIIFVLLLSACAPAVETMQTAEVLAVEAAATEAPAVEALAIAATATEAPAIKVETVWGRPSPMYADAGAFYMIITNQGTEADKLIAAAAGTACGKVELHTTTKDSAGNNVMQPVEAIDVPAGGSVELKPGGFHVMCMMRSPDFKPGTTIPVELTFEKAGLIKLEASLRWESIAVPETSIKVFNPGAMVEVTKALVLAFEEANPGQKVAIEQGHSPTHRVQIAEGAPGDVFISASEKDMTEAATANLVNSDEVRVFAVNKVIVILPPGNPANIQSLEDLTREGVKLLIADVSVPIGMTTDKVIVKLDEKFGDGYKEKLLANVVSKELGVAPIVSKIKLSEADAGIVFVSDASNNPDLGTIVIQDDLNLTVKFTIAPLTNARIPESAQTFVDFVMSDAGQAILAKFGFLPGER